jgi:hypothetical protein
MAGSEKLCYTVHSGLLTLFHSTIVVMSGWNWHLFGSVVTLTTLPCHRAGPPWVARPYNADQIPTSMLKHLYSVPSIWAQKLSSIGTVSAWKGDRLMGRCITSWRIDPMQCRIEGSISYEGGLRFKQWITQHPRGGNVEHKTSLAKMWHSNCRCRKTGLEPLSNHLKIIIQ